MKFQIILESTDPKRALMPDDEFERLAGRSLKMPGFRLVGARNLEGIRPECWEPAHRVFPAAQSEVDNLMPIVKKMLEQNRFNIRERMNNLLKTKPRREKDPLE